VVAFFLLGKIELGLEGPPLARADACTRALDFVDVGSCDGFDMSGGDSSDSIREHKCWSMMSWLEEQEELTGPQHKVGTGRRLGETPLKNYIWPRSSPNHAQHIKASRRMLY